MMEKITTEAFSFGKNWQAFVDQYLTEERIEIAARHIVDFLELPTLTGKSFIDIGCGSGLSSLAAYRLGALKIVSFDADPYSVQTTQKLREMVGNPAHWTVFEGSVLDAVRLRNLEPADIVYSWGVLHHTGHLWEALQNASGLMAEQGVLYISIYVTTPKSAYWTRIKQQYNAASTRGKRLMELWYLLWYKGVRRIIHFRNPFREMREYQRKRGMAYMTDIRDWLGGYPYEHAKIEEVVRFARKTLQLDLLNISTGEATIEYLFARHGQHTPGI